MKTVRFIVKENINLHVQSCYAVRSGKFKQMCAMEVFKLYRRIDDVGRTETVAVTCNTIGHAISNDVGSVLVFG